MVTWMQTGQGRQKTTNWGGGAGACKTSFKSSFYIKRNGENLPYKIQERERLWEDARPGDTIKYIVETGADNKVPKSDEFYFIGSTLNWEYIVGVVNEINRTASTEQKQRWENNPEEYNSYLINKLDESRLMLTISSRVEQTNEDGKFVGTLTIPPNWPSGAIAFAFIYGYDADARTSDISRLWSNIWDVASIAITVVELIAFFTICVGCGLLTFSSCTVGCAVLLIAAWTGLVVDMAILAHEQYTQGLAAQIGRNKYGCSFPEGAFIHTYSIILTNENVDPFRMLDIQAAQSNPVIAKQGKQSIVNNKMIITILLAVGLFMTIWATIGGNSDG